jgi:hypothetical protein
LLLTLPLFLFPRVLPDYPLPYHKAKVLAESGASYVVGLLAAVGIWLVHAAVRAELGTVRGPDQVGDFLRLRGHLNRLLAVEGTLIGAAVLAAGGLRNALVAGKVVEAADYSSLYILFYGAFFTMLLALAYVPTDLALIAAGHRLCEVIAPMPPLASDAWMEWYKVRGTLEDFLQLRVGPGTSLRAALAILAPLSSSLIALLVGVGS